MEYTWQAALGVVLWAWSLGVAALPLVIILGWMWGVILSHWGDHRVRMYRTIGLPPGTPIPPSSSETSSPSH